MTRLTRKVTITSGTSLSAAVEDLKGYTLSAIQMPAAWDAAAITLQAIAEKGGTYQDVHDDGGTEISISASAGQFLVLTSDAAEGIRAPYGVKLRSGTSATPVNQTADRELTLVFVG